MIEQQFENHLLTVVNDCDFDSLPQPDFIISFDNEGNPLSRYKDSEWDLMGYAYKKQSSSRVIFKLDNNSENAKILIEQIKLILYSVMMNAQQRGSARLINVLIKLGQRLKKIANICLKHECNFSNMRLCKEAVEELITYLCALNKRSAVTYLKELHKINDTKFKYKIENFGLADKDLKKIEKIVNDLDSDSKQTILIPTRIYADIITKSLDYIDQYYSQIEQIKQFSLEYFQGEFDADGFKNLVSRYKLEKLFKILGIEKQFLFKALYSHFQCIAGMMIMCFSGMRISEMQNLPINAYTTTTYNGQEIHVLNGLTSKKTVSGLRTTTWITSSAIGKAVECLRVICEIHKSYYEYKKFIAPSKFRRPDLNILELENYPLFPSFSFAGKEQPRYGIPVSEVYQAMNNWVERLLNPKPFTQEDLDELYAFNPLEDWDDYEDLQIGKSWRFKTHQFRRTLTVYSIRSGLVKVPTLKKQLQHISYDMTLHYGNNAVDSTNYIFEPDLINEFNNERLEHTTDLFLNILEQDDVLFGIRGTGLETQKGKLRNLYSDRKNTEKLIKAGQLHYKETPLGGCTLDTNCDRLGFAYTTACVTCDNAVFDTSSVKKIEIVKNSLEKQLSKYESGNYFHDQLKIEIKSIDKVLKKRITLIEVTQDV